jgi:hypothetical protein
MTKLFLPAASRGKRAIGWCLVVFACSQLALGAYLHWLRPELRDPVYGSRIHSLREQLAAHPGRSLLLFLGSSRAMNGVAPAALPELPEAPFVYNFAISGSGPVRVHLTFRRLLAEGVRPKWVVIETWPPMWPEAGAFDEKQSLMQDDLGWRDVPVLSRYLPGKLNLCTRAAQGGLAPLVCYRSRLMYAAAQSLLPRQMAWQVANELKNWQTPDGSGWIPVLNEPETPQAKQREVEHGQAMLYPLLNPLRIHPSSDHALRDLLADCKAHGIRTLLLLMPEHSQCRRWYPPQAHALVHAYLDEVSREYQAPVIDTRDWLSDDGFSDFCHMARLAAAPYSERFGREVLRPWLAGESLPTAYCLAGR